MRKNVNQKEENTQRQMSISVPVWLHSEIKKFNSSNTSYSWRTFSPFFIMRNLTLFFVFLYSPHLSKYNRKERMNVHCECCVFEGKWKVFSTPTPTKSEKCERKMFSFVKKRQKDLIEFFICPLRRLFDILIETPILNQFSRCIWCKTNQRTQRFQFQCLTDQKSLYV